MTRVHSQLVPITTKSLKHQSMLEEKTWKNHPLRIAVTTPYGALVESTRESLVKEIGVIVDDIVGPFEGRLNHWAMLYEIDEGSRAGGGQVFPLAGIQGAMNIKAA
jgi:hypothetical protein